ncbi:MAG: cupin domain-containing protein [Promethearchaeota archaeon]
MADFLKNLEFLSGKPALKRIVKSKKKFNIVRVCLEKGLEIKPHPEPYAVFFLVLSGSGIFTKNVEEVNLKKNDFIFIKADEIRGIKCFENLVVLGVQDGH